ncbi:hypothetical protein ACCT03_00095 [Rhizobium johnstonii]|uniref:hypothetical protein n=1 Tax=Rhizobium TaxID=379 RepID=UPI00102FCC69|nr:MULTISPECIES: hypothetical protein [Rhizobium]MBY5416096.1 hypothetical protein [Rhizobium leguminosarum]NEJ26999.1 hypothetical protein [Rhizobium ruizarguesonis]NKL64878.1 hypothetical protein [Rhizobium leguminosarum bv. viciae]TBF83162.1 hypothetical protein ELG86_13985 [Rhizobium leguminosarum]TBG92592.1 hypothetical protein ELG70_38895 [Rhizobium leguminosarum]
MRRRVLATLKTAFLSIIIIAGLCPAVEAACWSALKSPEWPQLAASIATIKLCEQLPGGPDRTKKFEVTAVDLCTAANGVSITAKASLTCGSSSGAFIQTPPLDGRVVATVTLDIGECRIMESNIDISGEVGGLLSSLPQTQQFARSWAQSRLSHLCGLQ